MILIFKTFSSHFSSQLHTTKHQDKILRKYLKWLCWLFLDKFETLHYSDYWAEWGCWPVGREHENSVTRHQGSLCMRLLLRSSILHCSMIIQWLEWSDTTFSIANTTINNGVVWDCLQAFSTELRRRVVFEIFWHQQTGVRVIRIPWRHKGTVRECWVCGYLV